MNSDTVRTSMVSVQALRTLVESIERAGVRRADILRSVQLDPAELQSAQTRVARSKLFELLEVALDLTQDPAFGLHSVEQLTGDALNPIAALVAHAPTLRDALNSLQEFRRLLGDDASFQLHEDASDVIVRCESLASQSLRVQRCMAEVGLLGLFLLIRRFRPDAQVNYVAFEYGAPDYHQEYARLFDGRARFEQPHTELCFEAKLLAAPAPHADAALHDALRVFAARRVMHLNDRTPYATRVRDLLVWQAPPRDTNMASIARKLGVSVRSLRRRLTLEGKPYPELVTEALTTIAKTCLRDERRTILETAFELGFADNTSFHRAFKRWTGLTPLEFRRQHAAQDYQVGDMCSVEKDPV